MMIDTVGFLLGALGGTWEDVGARLDKSLKACKRILHGSSSLKQPLSLSHGPLFYC
jgi:hypothetical protein